MLAARISLHQLDGRMWQGQSIVLLSTFFLATSPALCDTTNTGQGSAAIGVNNGTVNIDGSMVSAEDRGRRIINFLTAKQLPIPGRSYSDSELALRFGLAQRGGFNFSYDVLSGSFNGLTAVTNSAVGRYAKIVLQKNGEILAVQLQQSCEPNALTVCASNFNDWKGAIQNIEGNQIQEGVLKLGGAGPGPFPSATLRKSYAYDGEWRFYIDRMDAPDGGGDPSAITLLVVREH